MSKLTELDEKKKDFDPVLWVGRLIEVNRDSQFTKNEKITINAHLLELQKLLRKLI